MNSVQRVKEICATKNIPISKLEKDLGFGNGYIGQLRKGTFPADRLAMIADYLNVTSDYLLTGNEKAPSETGEGIPHAALREYLVGQGVRIMLDADAKVTEQTIVNTLKKLSELQEQNNK